MSSQRSSFWPCWIPQFVFPFENESYSPCCQLIRINHGNNNSIEDIGCFCHLRSMIWLTLVDNRQRLANARFVFEVIFGLVFVRTFTDSKNWRNLDVNTHAMSKMPVFLLIITNELEKNQSFLNLVCIMYMWAHCRSSYKRPTWF